MDEALGSHSYVSWWNEENYETKSEEQWHLGFQHWSSKQGFTCLYFWSSVVQENRAYFIKYSRVQPQLFNAISSVYIYYSPTKPFNIQVENFQAQGDLIQLSFVIKELWEIKDLFTWGHNKHS